MSLFTRVLATLAVATSLSVAQVTFTHNTSAPSMSAPMTIATGDFDRDGNVDFAIAFMGDSPFGYGGNGTTVYFGDGKGNVRNTTTLPANFGPPTSIAVADVNLDGSPDLVETTNNGQTVVFMNDGKGNFTQGAVIQPATQGDGAAAVVARDFNNDGYTDIAVDECDPGSAHCFYQIYLNNKKGTFTRSQSIALGSIIWFASAAAADYNLDGNLDLAVVTAPNNVQVWNGDGHGGFTLGWTQTIANAVTISTGDFNNDAVADLAVVQSTGAGGTVQVAVLLNNGHGAFTQSSVVPSPTTNLPYPLVAVGDINGDGNQDILWTQANQDGTGSVEYALGDGKGRFGAVVAIAEPYYPQTVEVRDLNHDGRQDIIAGLHPDFSGQVDVLINQNATFQCATPPSAGDGVNFCSPQPNTQVNSPFTVQVATNSPFKIVRTEAWVSGVKKAQSLSDELKASITEPNGIYTLTIIAVDSAGNYSKTNIPFTVNGSAGGGGNCPTPVPNTVNICTPTQNSTVPSPVQFTATTNTSQFTLNRIYVDNQPVFNTNSQNVNTQLTLSPGAHYIVLVSYSNTGASYTASRNITVSGQGCAVPAQNQINICSPAQNANTTSPVQFTAQTNTANFTLNRIYVDNVAVYQVQSQNVSNSLSLSLGTHNIVLVSYNSQGQAFTASRSITVH